MKPLLVYYSFTGNNKLLIKSLQNILHSDIHEITTITKRTKFTIFLDMFFHRNPKINTFTKNIADYDLVIFVAPIWMETLASPLKSFLTKVGQQVKDYAFITLSGIKGNRYIERDLVKLLGNKPLKITELAVSSLLPEDQKETPDYKVHPEEMTNFEKEIKTFIQEIELVSVNA